MFLFLEQDKPGMVSCDFERAIWIGVTTVLPNAKVREMIHILN